MRLSKEFKQDLLCQVMNTWLKRGLIALIVIMLLSAFLIIRDNDLSFSEKGSLKEFSRLYTGWAKNVFGNVQGITAYAIKADWLPGN